MPGPLSEAILTLCLSVSLRSEKVTWGERSPQRRRSTSMNGIGLAILLASIALSVAITVLSHGHVVLIALPLLIGVPLAGVFGRRR